MVAFLSLESSFLRQTLGYSSGSHLFSRCTPCSWTVFKRLAKINGWNVSNVNVLFWRVVYNLFSKVNLSFENFAACLGLSLSRQSAWEALGYNTGLTRFAWLWLQDCYATKFFHFVFIFAKLLFGGNFQGFILLEMFCTLRSGLSKFHFGGIVGCLGAYGHFYFCCSPFPIKICDWFLACFTCGVKLLE